jgi:hypothetical protein
VTTHLCLRERVSQTYFASSPAPIRLLHGDGFDCGKQDPHVVNTRCRILLTGRLQAVHVHRRWWRRRSGPSVFKCEIMLARQLFDARGLGGAEVLHGSGGGRVGELLHSFCILAARARAGSNWLSLAFWLSRSVASRTKSQEFRRPILAPPQRSDR